MSSTGSLHIIQSSEAAARLRAAEDWLNARADRGALIVSASRGAADDLARPCRGCARGHGRSASLQLRAAGCPPRGAGARGARHRAGDAHWLRGGRRARDVRRAAGRRAGVLRCRRRHARFSARARADAARARDGRRRAGGPSRAAARRRRSRAPARGIRRAVCRRRPRPAAPRSSTPRAKAPARVPACRCCCSTCRWNRLSSSIWRGT